MIEVRDVRKSYGQVRAVDGVSYEIARGETFGLLGPNGAGKTTTTHLMSGILTPDEGSVLVDGRAPTSRRVRRGIGVAPQRLALYGELSGDENVRFFGRLYGLSGRALKERARDALDFCGLVDRRHDKARTYSGGMLRRLNLACAIVHDPGVLVLDEPTVGVDPQSRNHIFEGIEALKARGRTIVYTTHYMEEAQRLCDRVAVFDCGRVLALGTVDDLIAAHGGRSLVTAELMDVPDDPSILPGTLEGTRLQFEAEDPLRRMGELMAAGVVFRSIHVDTPNLETVFLALTGRRLRD